MRYTYKGDRFTDERWRGRQCDPVRRPDGKCVVGRSKAAVLFDCGTLVFVNRRMLRLNR